MSNIKLKRSAIPGKVPTTSQLDLGEFAVNTYDGKLYTKKNVDGNESIVTFTALAATDTLVNISSFTANGTATSFTLAKTPSNEDHVSITINGVAQHIDAYSIVGNAIQFTEAPASGDQIEARSLDLVSTAISVRDYQSYVYTANNQTTFSGADTIGRILEYDVDKIEVYANGVRLVNPLDYTATTGTSVVTSETITGTVEIVSLSRASILDNTNQIKPVNTSLANTSINQVVDTFEAGVYRTAKYLVQVSANNNYHATEILLTHNGTNTYTTEYATITSGSSLATFDSDISGGFVRLLMTPTTINTDIKIQRIAVAV